MCITGRALLRGIAGILILTPVVAVANANAPERPGGEPAAAVCHVEQGQATPFFSDLFKVYTPRARCMFLEKPVIWLHFVSDLIIAVAYFSIPVALIYFVRRRRDIAFHWIFWMFAAFIMACGTTHLFGVWDLWQPFYRLDGLVRAGTAAISIVTAIALWPLIPKALALPSPAQLEMQVAERTSELKDANEALHREIMARRDLEVHREQLLESERAARGEAERANRLKDEFLATLSHELRTPLNAILGWSHILRGHAGDDETIAEAVTVIDRNTRVQSRLIEDLLDVSRIISGKLRLDVQIVSLSDVIQEAIQAVAPAAEAKEIQLTSVLDPAAGRVSGDPARLQQVVWNLLSNAIKFTPKGGRVQVRLENIDSHVEMVVIDTGMGIRAELMPHLFERFRQGDASTTRQHGGLGLGLAIVRHIVEAHGGSVHVSSAGPGQGTTFRIKLPIRPAHSDIPEPIQREHPSSITHPWTQAETADLSGVRVLVVDDETDARQLVSKLLSTHHAVVIQAASAAEAFNRLTTESPNIVLCDIGMPGEDGYQFMRRVRSLPAEQGGRVPAIAVTAYARAKDRTAAMRAGFNNFVSKPFEPAELLATIANLVRGAGAGGESQ